MLLCITQAEKANNLLEIISRIDSDILGAMGIVTVVMSFVFAIITVGSVTKTIQNVSLAKMHRNLIQEMLAKGYSCEEIDMLVNGKRKGVFTRFFDGRKQEYVSGRPVPPVKTGRS